RCYRDWSSDVCSSDLRVDFGRFSHSAEQRSELFRQVLEGLRFADGVSSAAEARIVPMTGSGWNEFVRAVGNIKPGVAWFNAVGRSEERRVGREGEVGG